MQVAETPEKETQADKPPELPQAPSNRLTATIVSLAALGIIGAATANFLPSFGGISLPSFGVSLPSVSLPSLDSVSLPNFANYRLSLPKFDHLALPNFSRTPPPKSDRVTASAAAKPVPAPVLIPDAVLRAGLRDVQSTQQQHSAALETLTQAAETQQADMKRVTRQLSSLTAQVNALHAAVKSAVPLTTSSIPQSNPRARLIRTARRAPPASPTPPAPPPLAQPVGPVSVGGAPLAPTPASGSGA
jgi:hypothetical protein